MTDKSNSGSAFTASCSCGACRIELEEMPAFRFFCHCTICQSVYPGDYADATLMRASKVKVLTPETIVFAKHKIGGLERGICKSCKHPVIAFMDGPMMPQLAFVPTAIFPGGTPIPKPARHIFYGTRVADVEDNVPKTEGERASMLALTPALLKVILQA